MPDIKPIETVYNGYRFRSRLEARWAVFFDAAGIEYQYEPEGFVLSNGEYYLPDFYLPDMRAYVEIKPQHSNELDSAVRKLERLFSSDSSEKEGIIAVLCVGEPYDNQIKAYCNYSDDEGGGTWWFDAEFRVNFTVWQDCKTTLYEVGKPHLVIGDSISETDKVYMDSAWEVPSAVISLPCLEDIGYGFDKEMLKARQARFEHGECG